MMVRDGRKRMSKYIAGAIVAGMLTAAAPAVAQEKLTVFWSKGFYKAEDDALFAAVKKFEDKTKVKVPTCTTSRSPANGPSRASSKTFPT